MSKKKNKFKKKKAHRLGAIAVSTQAVEIANPISESLEESFDHAPSPVIQEEKPDAYKTDKYAHVKVDIKKILIIMAIIILVLFGVYVLSLKTTILDSFGNWIYKILNIQTS